jgi:predicted RNA-binding protein with PIN domain
VLVLVDGRNVQRSRWPNVSDEELVAACAAWAARGGHRAVVVFDGRAPEREPDETCEVVGTGGESADDWIARRVGELDGAAFWLVTSDRELCDRAGASAAEITGGGRFLSLLGLR